MLEATQIFNGWVLVILNNNVIISYLYIPGNTAIVKYNLPISMNVKGYAGIDTTYSHTVGHPAVTTYTTSTISCRFGAAGRLIVIGSN